ncbi:MAG: chlorite dismutase family protein [Chloroflexi bacterium]|nr:chlorite dismutase family protein [Chloroflexota bacterium]
MGQERRQVVKYNFYRVDPAWRRLSETQRDRGRQQFLALVDEFSGQAVIRSYSLVGLRGDVDLLLWLVADSIEVPQALAEGSYRTGLGKYLTMPYSYLALTRRSPYVQQHHHAGQEGAASVLRISDKEYPYLIVYPFVKTHQWYQLPKGERQRMMEEHFAIGHKYPSVRINTAYSFGLDDQDHVVAFETTSLADFLELVMELREAPVRLYTQRDTPTFTCVRRELPDVLASLG